MSRSPIACRCRSSSRAVEPGKIYMSVARFPKGQMALYRRVDRIQCVSSHVAQAVISQSPSMARLVCTIPNAIGSGFADAIDEHRGSREKTVLFVGRVAKEKNVETLIRGFARVSRLFPDWRLSIVGSSPNDTWRRWRRIPSGTAGFGRVSRCTGDVRRSDLR